MNKKNLTQYVFADGHEEIADHNGKIIIIKDADIGYIPLGMFFKPYIRGSIPERDTDKVSRIPKVNEHLLTSKILGFNRCISNTKIREINQNFQLS